jgi:hypothetical protein
MVRKSLKMYDTKIEYHHIKLFIYRFRDYMYETGSGCWINIKDRYKPNTKAGSKEIGFRKVSQYQLDLYSTQTNNSNNMVLYPF